MTTSPVDAPRAPRPYRLARALTGAGLLVLGLLGLANSWGSLYSAATTHLAGTGLPTVAVAGWTFSTAGASLPLLLDVLICVASARYVIGVLERRPVGGWRVAAHSAIAATVVFNALAARQPSDVLWHVIAPSVLSAVVELVAREILGQLREVTHQRADVIPLRLWLTSPAESARVAWRMARTGCTSAADARAETERCAAARDRLRGVMPARRHRRARRQILRRLWSGALAPERLVDLVVAHANDPALVLSSVLDAVAHPAHRPIGPAQGLRPIGPTLAQAGPTASAQPGPVAHGPMGRPAQSGPTAHPARPTAHESGPPRPAQPRPNRPKATPVEATAGKPSPQDVVTAHRNGELPTISRAAIKDHYGIRSNSTAGQLLKDARDLLDNATTTT